MADKVVFRRGVEEDLPTEGNIQPGSFYVITDKKRLLYGQDENNLIEFGSVPFVYGPKKPDDTRVFWIDTNAETGGLRFYNDGKWDHVPVAFTSKNTTTEEGTITETPPTNFSTYGTYLENFTWYAPSDGWYRIEVFGASGNGGTPTECEVEELDSINDIKQYQINCWQAAGGGSGGYTSSVVPLRANDTVTITIGAPGVLDSPTSAAIESTYDTNYSITMTVESGGNGGGAAYNESSASYSGDAGAGGTVSAEGNEETIVGNAGVAMETINDCRVKNIEEGDYFDFSALNGGAAIVSPSNGSSGTVGGKSAYIRQSSIDVINMVEATSGQFGFVVISKGN